MQISQWICQQSTFKIENADLKDQQTGTIALGTSQWRLENIGYQFQPELLFKLNPDFALKVLDLGFFRFWWKPNKNCFVVPDSDASFLSPSPTVSTTTKLGFDGGYANKFEAVIRNPRLGTCRDDR